MNEPLAAATRAVDVLVVGAGPAGLAAAIAAAEAGAGVVVLDERSHIVLWNAQAEKGVAHGFKAARWSQAAGSISWKARRSATSGRPMARFVVRRNRVHDNNASGIQLNQRFFVRRSAVLRPQVAVHCS